MSFRKDVCRLYKNAAPFSIRDSSSYRLGIHRDLRPITLKILKNIGTYLQNHLR